MRTLHGLRKFLKESLRNDPATAAVAIVFGSLLLVAAVLWLLYITDGWMILIALVGFLAWMVLRRVL